MNGFERELTFAKLSNKSVLLKDKILISQFGFILRVGDIYLGNKKKNFPSTKYMITNIHEYRYNLFYIHFHAYQRYSRGLKHRLQEENWKEFEFIQITINKVPLFI